MHDLTLLFVWLVTVYFTLKERKLRIKAENELKALSDTVAKVASESAIANAALVEAQAPLVQHHEMLLDYLRRNEGKSIDEAKDALSKLKIEIEEAGLRVAAIKSPLPPQDVNESEGSTHHRRLLEHIRMNPGISVDKAKEALNINGN